MHGKIRDRLPQSRNKSLSRILRLGAMWLTRTGLGGEIFDGPLPRKLVRYSPYSKVLVIEEFTLLQHSWSGDREEK